MHIFFADSGRTAAMIATHTTADCTITPQGEADAAGDVAVAMAGGSGASCHEISTGKPGAESTNSRGKYHTTQGIE